MGLPEVNFLDGLDSLACTVANGVPSGLRQPHQDADAVGPGPPDVAVVDDFVIVSGECHCHFCRWKLSP